MVVFSEGRAEDSGSKHTAAIARDLGIAVYPVLVQPLGPAPLRVDYSSEPWRSPPPGLPGLGAPANPNVYSSTRPTAATESIAAYLEMAAATGGRQFREVPNQDLLRRILADLAKEIRYEYIAGYHAPEGVTGRRTIEVVWRGRPRGKIIGGKRTVVY